jgi:ribonuclease P protein component
MGASFSRELRVRDRRDFQRIGRVGRRAGSGLFVAFLAPLGPTARQAVTSRLGVTVSRRVGNAVVRNRVKRQLREWFRHARSAMPEARDVVVIARPAAGSATRTQIRTELEKIRLQLGSGGSLRGEA